MSFFLLSHIQAPRHLCKCYAPSHAQSDVLRCFGNEIDAF